MPEHKMYELPVLIKRWHREQMTVEQMIGQILLHLKDLKDRFDDLEWRGRRPPDAGPPN